MGITSISAQLAHLAGPGEAYVLLTTDDADVWVKAVKSHVAGTLRDAARQTGEDESPFVMDVPSGKYSTFRINQNYGK